MPLVDLHLPRTGACPKRSLLSSVNSNSRKSSTNAYLKRALSQSARRGAEAPGAATSAASSLPPISWPEYLAIRKSRKRWETIATVPCALLGLGGGFLYFGTQDIDPTKPLFGMDPMIMYGAGTVACAGAGALVGPTLGASIWRMMHRARIPLIEARERDFYSHVKRNRVDPSAQSASNPVPDFYGEKIGSLHEYRQWLRDQNKFRRKAQWSDE